MLPTLTGAPFLMDRSLLVLLLLLRQSVVVITEDTAAAAMPVPPGANGDIASSMCGQRQGARRVRCVPRDELPSQLKHQYTLDQVVGIVQDIKHRLGHLQVPNVEKQRKGKGRRRPTQQQ